MTDGFTIGGVEITRGERKIISLEVAKLYDFTDMTIPVEVIRGKEDGPILFVCAAVHGDEINGVEIIRRLLTKKALGRIKGTLITVPIVNVFGFNSKSRYLPDRRDMNRHFPGSDKGSLTAQLADTFMTEIVSKCTHGIDLHCAAINRINLPQIRVCLDDEKAAQMAGAFNMPVIIDSPQIEGSLRKATYDMGIPTLVFEGGESLRFNEKVIRSGLKGVISVMREIGMLKKLKEPKTKHEAFIARSSHWIRAPHSGILSVKKKLGEHVKKGQTIGVISDPFGREKFELRAKRTGIIIGASLLPLLNSGDAVFHIATFEDASTVEEHVEIFEGELEDEGNSERFV